MKFILIFFILSFKIFSIFNINYLRKYNENFSDLNFLNQEEKNKINNFLNIYDSNRNSLYNNLGYDFKSPINMNNINFRYPINFNKKVTFM